VTIPLVVATWYAGVYVGRDLYCGGVYAETTQSWVALPIQDDTWQCGDLVYLSFGNGDALMARVLDTGPFGDNCVIMDDDCVPIVTDVPRHLWPDALAGQLSAPVQVTNITAMYRLWADQGAPVEAGPPTSC
jgi:hypothetical protein